MFSINDDAIEMVYLFNNKGYAARIIIGSTELIMKSNIVLNMILSPESMNQDRIEGIYLNHEKGSKIVNAIILNDELGKICINRSSSKEDMANSMKVLLNDLRDVLLNKMSRYELENSYEITEEKVINFTNFSNYNDQIQYPAAYCRVGAEEIVWINE